jgi:hypothetical protein
MPRRVPDDRILRVEGGYPIDMETAVFVLATFFHADPLRRQLVSGERYLKPYGDKTEYVLRKVYDLPEAAADGGLDDDE